MSDLYDFVSSPSSCPIKRAVGGGILRGGGRCKTIYFFIRHGFSACIQGRGGNGRCSADVGQFSRTLVNASDSDV